jgi:TRAP-type C4-dicarboxylate transport system permease large subunit
MVIIIMLAYPFAQVAAHFGYDPIHFGLVFVLAATIGGITPPVGSLLFVACSIGRVGLTEGSRAIWPFVVALVLVTAVLIAFPSISTIVPQLFF